MSDDKQPADTPETPEILESPSGVSTQPPQQRQRLRQLLNRIRRWYIPLRRRIHFRTTFIFVATVFVLIVSLLNTRVTDAIDKLGSSWRRTEQFVQTLDNQSINDLKFDDFERLQVRVADLQRQIDNTRSSINPIRRIFQFNSDWQTSSDLLEVSDLLVRATSDMLRSVEPIVKDLRLTDDLSLATDYDGLAIAADLRNGQGFFLRSAGNLSTARDWLDEIDTSELSLEHLLSYYRIEQYHQRLVKLNSILTHSPEAMLQAIGIDNEVTYLILIQNNDELRPSGGRLSAYGWISMQNGRLTDFDITPATAETNPQPPNRSFANTYDIPDWWLNFQNPLDAAWDGGWDVDFPSTAQRALDYYNQGENVNAPVDGVIALDLNTLEKIMTVINDVDLANYDRFLYAHNFREVLYDTTAYVGQDQKSYLAEIYAAILQKFKNVERGKIESLVITLLDSLDQKHIMIYSTNETVQETVELVGWSGAQLAQEMRDYFMVADTNLVNKSDHSIAKTFTYQVEIQPDLSRLSDLQIRYDYFDFVANNDPAVDEQSFGSLDYRTLTQVHLPKDATILDDNATSPLTVDNEGDYTIAISRIDVDFNTSQRFDLQYETPPSEEQFADLYKYRLLIQKQPGSQSPSVTVQITLPANASVFTYTPSANFNAEDEQVVFTYDLSLTTDHWIEVVYSLE